MRRSKRPLARRAWPRMRAPPSCGCSQCARRRGQAERLIHRFDGARSMSRKKILWVINYDDVNGFLQSAAAVRRDRRGDPHRQRRAEGHRRVPCGRPGGVRMALALGPARPGHEGSAGRRPTCSRTAWTATTSTRRARRTRRCDWDRPGLAGPGHGVLRDGLQCGQRPAVRRDLALPRQGAPPSPALGRILRTCDGAAAAGLLARRQRRGGPRRSGRQLRHGHQAVGGGRRRCTT